MSTLTAEQATELGDHFSKMGDDIRDFFIGNFDRLTPEERQILSTRMTDLWGKSRTMYTLSATLVLHHLEDSLQQIQGIQSGIQTTLKNLSNVQKVIDISGAALGLAAALLGKDPEAIGTAIEALAGKISEARTNG